MGCCRGRHDDGASRHTRIIIDVLGESSPRTTHPHQTTLRRHTRLTLRLRRHTRHVCVRMAATRAWGLRTKPRRTNALARSRRTVRTNSNGSFEFERIRTVRSNSNERTVRSNSNERTVRTDDRQAAMCGAPARAPARCSGVVTVTPWRWWKTSAPRQSYLPTS